MRLGTLQLSSGWRKEDADAIVLRFRDLEAAITDLQMTPYSHLYMSQDPGVTLTLSPSGTSVPLTGAIQDHADGFLYDTSLSGTTNKVTCLVPAHYFVTYSISFEVDASTKHVEVAVMVNGVWQEESASHFDFQTDAIEVTISGSVIVELRCNDYIEIAARCVGSTTTITYEHFNSTITRVHL